MHTKLLLGATAGLIGLSGAAFAADTISSSPMQLSSDRSEVDGTSTLIRSRDGASFTLDTRHLRKNAPYTIWWVVFNKPQACEEPYACGAVDLDNPAVETGLFWATGRLADRHGQATFAAEIDVGELPTEEGQLPHPVAVNPLTDPKRAEIHLVVRGHGRKRGAHLEAQLTTLNGGCPPNDCGNVQFSIHASPNS
ncbi:MAG: hypothetical protein AAF637_13700 [Pseudomonadota bacterium]